MTISNKSSANGRYTFDAIEEQLGEPGAYVLQFQVSPPLFGMPAVQLCTHIIVTAGPPRSIEIKARTCWAPGCAAQT